MPIMACSETDAGGDQKQDYYLGWPNNQPYSLQMFLLPIKKAVEYKSGHFDIGRFLSVQLKLNIKAGGENEPWSVYYKLEAGQYLCTHNSSSKW